jgi:hypothetical protein
MIGSLCSPVQPRRLSHMSLCFPMSLSHLMILPVPIVADWLGICKTGLGSSI